MPIPHERLRDRRAKLEAELKALRAKEQAEEERRCLIVGRAVLDEAATDEAFRETLKALLERRLGKTRERQAFGLAVKASRDEAAPPKDASGTT